VQTNRSKDLKNIKVVDVWKLFKSVYPKHRFSSLAFITETMLGKELCKDQTLTNWQRRPLRRNQLHYAAMDAVIVIKIYDKFVEEIGEQMVQYYC
jgi:ribonuclease D